MYSKLNEAVNKLMDGFFQQQEENQRLHKRCDELQTELRAMKDKLVTEHEEFERRIEAASKSFENLTLDYVLVGFIFNDITTPFFMKKNPRCSVFKALQYEAVLDNDDNFISVLGVNIESFRYFDPSFDLAEWNKSDFIQILHEDKYLCEFSNQISVDLLMANPTQDLKNLYKVCKDLGIKFVVNGSDSVNGVPIATLLS